MHACMHARALAASLTRPTRYREIFEDKHHEQGASVADSALYVSNCLKTWFLGTGGITAQATHIEPSIQTDRPAPRD